ncbi:hypothetical protein [Noviherbaspirillum aerium]|uniref:hypothetical protein n=1 Tax=Noviherbaspirillum aerium TaxID=2588497 RepID=UPI00124EDFB5|nr:hypothetical protein [Noviherbaspirillum aerium]
MSAEHDRMRRILGIELAEAGRMAGVTGPIARKPPQKESDAESGAEDLLNFTSFEQYLTWLAAGKRDS